MYEVRNLLDGYKNELDENIGKFISFFEKQIKEIDINTSSLSLDDFLKKWSTFEKIMKELMGFYDLFLAQEDVGVHYSQMREIRGKEVEKMDRTWAKKNIFFPS